MPPILPSIIADTPELRVAHHDIANAALKCARIAAVRVHFEKERVWAGTFVVTDGAVVEQDIRYIPEVFASDRNRAATNEHTAKHQTCGWF